MFLMSKTCVITHSPSKATTESRFSIIILMTDTSMSKQHVNMQYQPS